MIKSGDALLSPEFEPLFTGFGFLTMVNAAPGSDGDVGERNLEIWGIFWQLVFIKKGPALIILIIRSTFLTFAMFQLN